jgi:2-polyprenyl-6-methoxyphenol hydroxylase-like FAD-dependent oxidoreductase
LPNSPAQRRGVPQGRHVHGLFSGGSQALGRLFPGLLDELVAAGANVADDGDLSRVSIRAGGHELNRSGKFADPAAAVVYLTSRPLLEFHVRLRVRAIDNVKFLDGHDVVEPIADQPHRVTGARVINRDTGDEAVLDAELVIDAMGRGARTPAFLANHGYDRPVEQRSVMRVSYSSQLLRIPPDMVTEKMTLVFPVPGRPTNGALLAYENGTWMLTVGVWDGHAPAADFGEMVSCTEQFVPPRLVAALRAAEPLGEVSVYRYPGSVWRRYDKMRRFPAGLLVIGDAICSFNPVYGQGMTVAALEASALRECLARRDADLGRRFFRAVAKHVGPVWLLNRGNEFSWFQFQDRRSLLQQLMNWGNDKVVAAAENDSVITEALFRVTNFIDSPARLLHPSLIMRVVKQTAWCSAGPANEPVGPTTQSG